MDRLPEESTGIVELRDESQNESQKPKKSLRERWQERTGGWGLFIWLFFIVLSIADDIINWKNGRISFQLPTWAQAKPILVLLGIAAVLLIGVGYTIGYLERLRWPTAIKVTLLMLLLLAVTVLLIVAGVAVHEIRFL